MQISTPDSKRSDGAPAHGNFTLKGNTIRCVPHLCAPHHDHAESVHGDNHRWVNVLLIVYTHTHTGQLRDAIVQNLVNPGVLGGLIGIICSYKTSLILFICHRPPTEVDFLETPPRQEVF